MAVYAPGGEDHPGGIDALNEAGGARVVGSVVEHNQHIRAKVDDAGVVPLGHDLLAYAWKGRPAGGDEGGN